MTERPAPDVVVVGAASRDVVDDDPRGWRLGGGVTYGALTLARLGVRTGVILGLDRQAIHASELDLLEAAGANLVRVALESGPVFRNVEHRDGRVQTCLSAAQPLAVSSLPNAWRKSPAWLLAPVAAEVSDAWARVPSAESYVAFGWQGILRHLYPGERVWPVDPHPSRLLARADLVGVSRHDLPHALRLAQVCGWMKSPSELLLTAGAAGGVLLSIDAGRVSGGRRFPAIPSRDEVDPTGAGDTALAAVLAARIATGSDPSARGRDVHLAALASSLLVERFGLHGVPSIAEIVARDRELRPS